MVVTELVKCLTNFVFVLDKFVDEDALKFMRRVDPARVKDLRILTGKTHIHKEFKEIFSAFQKELSNLGVKVQCRVLNDADEVEIHDKYLLSQNLVYITPPWNVIHKRLGEIVRIKNEEHIGSLRAS